MYSACHTAQHLLPSDSTPTFFMSSFSNIHDFSRGSLFLAWQQFSLFSVQFINVFLHVAFSLVPCSSPYVGQGQLVALCSLENLPTFFWSSTIHSCGAHRSCLRQALTIFGISSAYKNINIFSFLSFESFFFYRYAYIRSLPCTGWFLPGGVQSLWSGGEAGSLWETLREASRSAHEDVWSVIILGSAAAASPWPVSCQVSLL